MTGTVAGLCRGALVDMPQVVKSHLFILCPNNSGSTFLGTAMALSRKVWSLPREGQHTAGFKGPHTLASAEPLIWGASADRRARYTNPAAYDWDTTRRAWYFSATAHDSAAPVFLTRSPPFLMIRDQLEAAFPASRFLLMLRNPFAAIEGILRRRSKIAIGTGETLEVLAARHIRYCFEQQDRNRIALGPRAMLTPYEAMCRDPARTAARIMAHVPEIDDLDLAVSVPVKGMYHEPLRDMNHEQIARLSPGQIGTIQAELRPIEGLLARYGYALDDPAAFSPSAAMV
ncbi:sulfotransferase [Anianabacter salinae]|uniref:sulfotransferase n=1 Tax=Anianabacter salinae TaxID=2851023 RepID=UPI00225E42BC|nr:sulfotransferase [Anianabacter salinae]MBV0913041.1 sulfotransferase [Anianabacter salinae]